MRKVGSEDCGEGEVLGLRCSWSERSFGVACGREVTGGIQGDESRIWSCNEASRLLLVEKQSRSRCKLCEKKVELQSIAVDTREEWLVWMSKEKRRRRRARDFGLLRQACRDSRYHVTKGHVFKSNHYLLFDCIPRLMCFTEAVPLQSMA